MKYLLDVNVLIACLFKPHPHHVRALTWAVEKKIVLCPITELGFLRVITHKRAYALPMAGARESLERFIAESNAERIPDDMPALESRAEHSEQITDHYLADLALRHGLKWATLDEGLIHAATELIR
jgi:toxin-antitoxin system PIN domain toxin